MWRALERGPMALVASSLPVVQPRKHLLLAAWRHLEGQAEAGAPFLRDQRCYAPGRAGHASVHFAALPQPASPTAHAARHPVDKLETRTPQQRAIAENPKAFACSLRYGRASGWRCDGNDHR